MLIVAITFLLKNNYETTDISRIPGEEVEVDSSGYIRLKTLSLSYAVPKRAVKKMGLNKLQIFIRGNNLFTWSPNYPLADPEASDGDNSNWTSWGYYPMLRRVTLGAQIAF